MRVWNDVRFRFEIQYQDGTSIGTMLSENSVSFISGENKAVMLSMNTKHLTPGRYKIDIVAYANNEYGTEQLLDGVYPGIVIEMNDTLNAENPITWLHGCWGHIHLHDVVIE